MASVDFQEYLHALLNSQKYEQWQERYTETDAKSRDRATIAVGAGKMNSVLE